MAKAAAQETQEKEAEYEECPLCCTVPGIPRRAFVKHVGRHMEEIALLALPRNVGEESDTERESDDTSTTCGRALGESINIAEKPTSYSLVTVRHPKAMLFEKESER